LQHDLFHVVFTSDYAYESLPSRFKNESMWSHSFIYIYTHTHTHTHWCGTVQ